MKKEIIFFLAGTLLILMAASIRADTNRLLINEFTVDPQTDWDHNSQINPSDEWLEIYNPGISSITIDNWSLKLIDSSDEILNLTGTISPGSYLTIINPPGTQAENGRIELFDSQGNLVDSVTYGSYNDGNLSDNAPNGASTNIYNECLARYPNGANTDVDSSDFTKTLCTYNSQNNFSFTPVNITNIQTQPSCVLDTDNILVRAEITGSIAQVRLLLNTDGTIKEIALPGTIEGTYSYTINSSKTTPGTTVEWQFVVTDVKGDTTEGETNSQRIFYATTLQIFPSSPTGLNGWYISEPQFELSNPDASQIEYKWNGIYHEYSAPFGLEGTPNSGNVTGGTHVLSYWSDVCNEPEKSFMGKFDFKDPVINTLTPPSGSAVLNSPSTIISAHIDEVYQGNSGINISSIVMKIDGQKVAAVAESTGLDANVAFEGNVSNGHHEVEVSAEDYSGRSSSAVWSFGLLPPVELNMTINSPRNNLYNDKRVQFNLTITRTMQEVMFINYDDPNPIFKQLCTDCSSFGNDKPTFKSLREGRNNLTFRAESNGDVLERNVIFVVDSKNPKILNVLPKSGLASGIFEVYFEEDNPKYLKVHFGNSANGFKNHLVNMSSDCQKDGVYHCISYVDLSAYDGSQIEFYVSLEDSAGNIAESRPRTLYVDIGGPVIDTFDLTIDGKYATFFLEVTEPFLDKITYIDHSEENPKEVVLCTSLIDSICQKKVSLREGGHNITVIVRDNAGNTAEAFADFFTDSQLPKIKSTEPKKGFASGLFVLNFEETNPATAYLNYGDIFHRLNKEVNLSDCTPDKKNFLCPIFVNLSSFEGQSISYWFNMTDKAGNYAESKQVSLKVDSTPPQITEFSYLVFGREVEFSIGIQDANFDEIIYRDRGENNPQFKTLCSKLSGGICKKTKRFSPGEHVLDIIAKDKAGNQAVVLNGFGITI